MLSTAVFLAAFCRPSLPVYGITRSSLILPSHRIVAAADDRQNDEKHIGDNDNGADLAACEEKPGVLQGTIFTLQERDDGWNDVRAQIINAGKERGPAWEKLQEKYISPTSRWAKVLGGEFAGMFDGAQGTAQAASKSLLPEGTRDILNAAADVASRVSERATTLREENKLRASQIKDEPRSTPAPRPAPKRNAARVRPVKPTQAKSPAKAPPPPSPPRDAVVATLNLGLVASTLSLPLALLIAIAFIVSPDTFAAVRGAISL